MKQEKSTKFLQATLILCLFAVFAAGSRLDQQKSTGPAPALEVGAAERKCSASCKFTSGSIKCGRGETATCSCDSTGNFSGGCFLAGALMGRGESDVSVSVTQAKALDVYLKSLRLLGRNGTEIADNLVSAKKAASTGDPALYWKTQDKVHKSFSRMDKNTQTQITSLVAAKPSRSINSQ